MRLAFDSITSQVSGLDLPDPAEASSPSRCSLRYEGATRHAPGRGVGSTRGADLVTHCGAAGAECTCYSLAGNVADSTGGARPSVGYGEVEKTDSPGFFTSGRQKIA